MAMTDAEYLQQLQALLPSGPAWPRDETATITRALAALAAEFSRIDARGEALLDEADPRTTFELLADWEQLARVVPGADAPLQARRDQVAKKLQGLGSIMLPYYVGLAAALGYEVYIEVYLPTMAGWVEAGDELMIQDDARIFFIWNVHISISQPVYNFHAGQSGAGEYLTWWRTAADLETLLEDLRPAHIQFLFSYE